CARGETLGARACSYGVCVSRLAEAADLDLAGVAERAVLDHGTAGKVDLAAVGDGAAGDGGGVDNQLAGAIDRDAAAAVGDRGQRSEERRVGKETRAAPAVDDGM